MQSKTWKLDCKKKAKKKEDTIEFTNYIKQEKRDKIYFFKIEKHTRK